MKNSMLATLITTSCLMLLGCVDTSTETSSRDGIDADRGIRPVTQVNVTKYPEVTGFYVPEKLPAEDIEVPQLYADLLLIMKNPNLPCNGREKYETIKKLMTKVDYRLVRETKTLNELFYHGDAIIDRPKSVDRTITFNYQYNNHYVRLSFFTYAIFVTGIEITEK